MRLDLWNAIKNDDFYADQDLAMAKVLKSYGFTGVLRVSPEKLLAAIDHGPFRYELPSPICFLFVDRGYYYEIDDLIRRCEERCP